MKQNRQRGGTLLGIVIGLVIGLGIALGVAMVITKTPIPFTDKSGRQKAPEPTAGQSGDPNQPLYRKRNGQPPELAPPANTATQPPAPRKEMRVAPPAPASTAGAPIVEQSTVAPEQAQDDKWHYYLQAGAFREMHDAESMRAKLALLGVEARVSDHQSETGLLYRVRAGPFDQMEAMSRVRTKLSDNGIDAAVVRISR